MPETPRVAVLIDCDNISGDWAAAIVAETARHGTLSIKRGYGDWTTQKLNGWRQALPQLAIQPVQQFAYVTGKNATDSALIIDAMDLLYSGSIDTFCLVSNDSDFTPLAMRLRESGKRVIGLGARHASQAFQNACDRFTYIEVIATRDATETTPIADAGEQPAVLTTADAAKILLPAITDAAKDDGWAALSAVGNVAVNREPTFDSRNYGYAKLGQLVRALSGVEVKEVSDGTDTGQIWVRRTGRGGTPTATATKATTATKAAKAAKATARKAAAKGSGKTDASGGKAAKASGKAAKPSR